MQKKVLVIGTGLGGLSTALRLAKKGYKVEILEKFNQPGGRLNQLKKDGFTFDIGPSFFSMTYEFEELAKDCGIDIPFEFVELDPLYSVYFNHRKEPYTIYKDLQKLSHEFKDVEPYFEENMKKYLDSAGSFFHDTMDLVIRRNYDSVLEYIMTLFRVPWGHAPKMLRTVWKELEKYFTSEEVKQIFSLVAFFLGATPFDTPAVYSLLSYTEMVHDGYHNVKGGMYKIIEGMLKEMEKEEIHIHYNKEIVDYSEKNGKLESFIDQDNREWHADIYVSNADAAVFRNTVMKRDDFSTSKLDRMKWTLAPFTLYLGVKGKIKNIQHHNYFLGDNFKDYANNIFKNKVNLNKPYYYVNVLSKFNKESAPPGCESVFILCPVPDLRYKPDWSDREIIAGNIIQDLSQRIGYDLSDRILTQTIFDPTDWKEHFNLYQGSGLGLAHDLNQIGGFRPKNFDEVYHNLYYVGSSTVPGTGLPMAIISSKLVVERIMKSHGTIS